MGKKEGQPGIRVGDESKEVPVKKGKQENA